MLFTYVLAVSTSSPLLATLSCKTKSRKPTILAVFKGKETFFLRGLGNAVLAVFGTFLVIYRSEFEDSSLNTI